MNHLIYGAALSAASRIMSGEVTIDGRLKSAVESTTHAMEDVSRTVGDLSVDKPATWARFARRLLQRSLNEKTIEWSEQWLDQRGYTRRESRLGALWLELCNRAPKSIAYREDREIIWRFDLGDGHFFIPLHVGESLSREGSSYPMGSHEVRLPEDPAAFEQLKRAIADFFWRGRQAVFVDRVGESEQFIDADQEGPGYVGPLNDQLEVWARYRDAGIRRCVLLQGVPGNGKSTFARQAARRLSNRTVILSSEAASNISASDWQLMLEVLRPEMIVIDDVDRLADSVLEGRLRMFEEQHCDVPFIIFTSNDHTRLPRPMRRPGRIDQILELDEPDRSVLEYVVGELAARQGVEIPAGRLDHLVDIAEETSTAHVVELLRRARVEGWDAQPLACDITFGDGFVADQAEAERDFNRHAAMFA